MEYHPEEVHATFAYASWPRRVASALIDFAALTVISVPFVMPTVFRVLEDSTGTTTASFTSGEVRTLTVTSIMLQVLYFTAMHAWRGSTLGKMATGTVLLRTDGAKVTPAVAFVRAVSVVGINFVSGILFAVPALLDELRPLWHPRRQTFHDHFAHTIVVLRPPSFPAPQPSPAKTQPDV